jgi:hypothetical protein
MNKIKWVPYTGKNNGAFFKVGDNSFSKISKDPKRKKCDLWDKIDEYMLH